jgi:hypothetical protein
MQITSFNNLQTNLSEIYASLHAQNADELSINFSPSQSSTGLNRFIYATSSHVYFQGTLIGQIIKVLDRAWRWIQPSCPSPSVEHSLQFILTTLFDHAVHCAYDVRQRRIWNNMRQIDQIWKNYLQPQDVAQQRERYANFLLKELKGSIEIDNPIYLADFDARVQQPLSDQEIKAMRHTIVNFHQATHIFWSSFLKDKDENSLLRQPLMHLIKTTSTLLDRVLFKALKKEGWWIQMEGIMQQPIPVTLFAKLEDPQNLTVDENRCLKFWIQTLNRCQQAISPRLFFCVLAEMINVIHLQGSSSLTLPDLLYWLDQQGCQIIHREDPAHMEWREKLSPGDTIECNGKQLTLGLQLSPDKQISDTYKIFELEEYPDYVIKIAHNRFLLLIEEKKAHSEQDHWGVRLVETIAHLEEEDGQNSIVSGLDQQGRCVVLEKLSSSFDSHVWTSDDMQLTQEDEKPAFVFANHLFCMSQWKTTAQNLSLSHLMWDKKGVLKSTRLLKKGSANYNEWEAYCANAAKGNLYVLSFLMNVSKLNEHEMALYYREVVEHVLETGETDLIGRPLPLGHRQDIYSQHAKKLCLQAQELKQNCLKIIIAHLRRKGQYSYKKEERLQQAVTDKLLEFYRVLPTPGRLSPNIEQQVVASFTQTSTLASWPDSLDAQDYYREKYELMMKYNTISLK